MFNSNGALLNAKLDCSVIHGTHRNCDIIPELIGVLCQTSEIKTMEQNKDSIYHIAILAKEAGENDEFWDSEDATEFCSELFDIANKYAPEGYYFGAHPGDGSDFGYWKCEE